METLAQRSCGVHGCAAPYYARGYCNTHYIAARRRGDELPPRLPRARAPCSVCGAPSVGRELCSKHYLQIQRHGELRPQHERRGGTCTVAGCGKKHGARGYCHQHYYKAFKRKLKNATLLRNFGISIDQYDAMLERQGGVCAICRGQQRAGFDLAVDHDHRTGAVRGLLCNWCNTMLARLKEDVAALMRAIEYLEHRQ